MYDLDTSQLWAEQLYANDGRVWTNASWNCPTCLANDGIVGFLPPDQIFLSCSYDWYGMALGWHGRPSDRLPPPFGSGHLSKDATQEQEKLAQSEMYAVTDARPTLKQNYFQGNPKMALYGVPLIQSSPAAALNGIQRSFCERACPSGQAERLSVSAVKCARLESQPLAARGNLGAFLPMGC